MAARRPHSKTKLGCTECKRRRIKCDEGRPDCDNCRKRSVTCSFHIFDPAPKSSPLASASASKKVSSRMYTFPQRPDDALISPRSPGLLDPGAQVALLKDFPKPPQPRFRQILQHFAADTIPTLAFKVEAQDAWREALPTIATKHKFVTHGILAIASLHLAQLAKMEEEQQTYEDIASTQMNAGLTQYRVEVQNVTIENADALFAFSTTITTFVLFTAGAECKATLRSIRSHNLSTEDRLRSISTLSHTVCRIFRFIRGVLVIIVPCWNSIQNGPLRPIVKREWWPRPVPIAAEQLEVDRKLRNLESIWSRPGRPYDYSFDALRNALKDLREVFALVSGLISLAQTSGAGPAPSFDWTSVICWPVQLSLEFISLLERRCMEAWVLVAHYAILPAKVTGVMWLDGLATNLITTAALIIGEENWELIAWPATAANVNLGALRNLA